MVRAWLVGWWEGRAATRRRKESETKLRRALGEANARVCELEAGLATARKQLATLERQATVANAERERIEERLRAELSQRHVQETELTQLWAVIARDRERVKAETAAAARQVAQLSE